jgi:polysaccharide export outer membrane protein
LRDKRLIDSPYFYLQQNDVLYIQPNNPRLRGSALGAVEAMSISVVGTLISLTSLIINIIK